MPRTGPRRKAIAVRLHDDGIDAIQELADREVDGNFSEMVRKLLAEAVAARRAKEQK